MEDGSGFRVGDGIGEVIGGIEVAQDEPVVLAPEEVPAVSAFCKDPV